MSSRMTITLETEKGQLRCKLDAEYDSIKQAGATCSGRIFFDDSGEKYLLCKNLSINSILNNSVDIKTDCEMVVIKSS